MTQKPLYLIPAIALSLGLVACERADDDVVGQRGDSAVAGSTIERRTDQSVAETRQETAEARQEAREATAEARQDMSAMGSKAAGAVSDATITAEVKSKLAADPDLSALRIDVDTENGVVTLSGPAPNEKLRAKATQIAATPEGVMRVENRLAVEKGS